jgi:4-diphosphocytidyl-2-C-methyl-D-erythritol kinase
VRLVAHAPGKVNLCLLVGPHRDDGRHEVVTLIESVSLADKLILTAGDGDEVSCPGIEGPNLVARALEGLRARGWEGPPVRIEIEKDIPIAGGMGGGSADAAAALRLARSLAPISDEALAELAAELGSDVPSQLEPGLTVGTGAGDQVSTREPLTEHALVIVPLDHRLSAADVYAEADRLGLGRSSRELTELLAGELPFVNDLEPAAISLCPAIADALAAVRITGADHAFVTGSGPTVCGLFWGSDSRESAQAAARDLPAAKCAVPVRADFGYPRNPAQSAQL